MPKVICWNVEDFKMLPINYTKDLYQNLDYDIFLIQEWKHIGMEDEHGGAFLKGLNNEHGGKYAIVFVDRVAVIYDSLQYDILMLDGEMPAVFSIKLMNEPATRTEKFYTTGRDKVNLLVILKPLNDTKPIAVIVTHLNAFNPKYHPNFHAKQFTKLLADSLYNINTYYGDPKDINIIIGGDTNYRKYGVLKDAILRPDLLDFCEGEWRDEIVNMKMLISELGLEDVCTGTCENQATQSLRHIHETNFVKKTAFFTARALKKIGKLTRTHSDDISSGTLFKDARLDIILTNMKYSNPQILKNIGSTMIKDLSDHYPIRVFLEDILEHQPPQEYGGKLKKRRNPRKTIKPRKPKKTRKRTKTF